MYNIVGNVWEWTSDTWDEKRSQIEKVEYPENTKNDLSWLISITRRLEFLKLSRRADPFCAINLIATGKHIFVYSDKIHLLQV